MNESSRSKRNKKNILHLAAFLVIALLVFVLPFVVLAIDDPNKAVSEEQESNVPVQGGAFEVTDYDLSAIVGKDHTYTVEEKISVNIPDQLQSVEFAIPSGNFRIGEIEVENALYKAKTASEASKVVISDPEKLT